MYKKLISSSFLCGLLSAASMVFGMEKQLQQLTQISNNLRNISTLFDKQNVSEKSRLHFTQLSADELSANKIEENFKKFIQDTSNSCIETNINVIEWDTNKLNVINFRAGVTDYNTLHRIINVVLIKNDNDIKNINITDYIKSKTQSLIVIAQGAHKSHELEQIKALINERNTKKTTSKNFKLEKSFFSWQTVHNHPFVVGGVSIGIAGIIALLLYHDKMAQLLKSFSLNRST